MNTKKTKGIKNKSVFDNKGVSQRATIAQMKSNFFFLFLIIYLQPKKTEWGINVVRVPLNDQVRKKKNSLIHLNFLNILY